MIKHSVLSVGAASILLFAASNGNINARVGINEYSYIAQTPPIYKIETGINIPPSGAYRPDDQNLNTVSVKITTSELVGIPGFRILIDDSKGNEVYQYSEIDNPVIKIARKEFDFSHKINESVLSKLPAGKYTISTEIINRGTKEFIVGETFSTELKKGQFAQISRIDGSNTTSATITVNPKLRGTAAQLAAARLSRLAVTMVGAISNENKTALKVGLTNHAHINNYEVITRSNGSGLVQGTTILGTSTAFDSSAVNIGAKNYLITILSREYKMAVNSKTSTATRTIAVDDGTITITFTYGWIPSRGINVLQ